MGRGGYTVHKVLSVFFFVLISSAIQAAVAYVCTLLNPPAAGGRIWDWEASGVKKWCKSRFNRCILSGIIETKHGGHACNSRCPGCAAKASDCIAFRAKVIRHSGGVLLLFRLSKSQTGAALIQGFGRRHWGGSCEHRNMSDADRKQSLPQEGACPESQKYSLAVPKTPLAWKQRNAYCSLLYLLATLPFCHESKWYLESQAQIYRGVWTIHTWCWM